LPQDWTDRTGSDVALSASPSPLAVLRFVTTDSHHRKEIDVVSGNMLPRFLRMTQRKRRAWCVLLIAALGLAPVVSVVAHAHEASHAAFEDTHFHAVEPHVADGQHASDDSLGDALHGLAHAAHACGHVMGIIPSDILVLQPRTQPELLPDCAAPPAQSISQHPFRPPIRY
jgi:hypothetical protein